MPVAVLRVSASPLPEDYFRYNILKIENTAPGQFPKVTFSVTNPLTGNVPYNIKTDPPFTATSDGSTRLFVQVAWSTSDYTNKGSGSERGVPPAAAQPIGINALSASVQNPELTLNDGRVAPRTVRTLAVGYAPYVVLVVVYFAAKKVLFGSFFFDTVLVYHVARIVERVSVYPRVLAKLIYPLFSLTLWKERCGWCFLPLLEYVP